MEKMEELTCVLCNREGQSGPVGFPEGTLVCFGCIKERYEQDHEGEIAEYKQAKSQLAEIAKILKADPDSDLIGLAKHYAAVHENQEKLYEEKERLWEALEDIRGLAVGYDGFSSSEGLESLIDDMRDIATAATSSTKGGIGMECECTTWVRGDGQIWTKHHPKCSKFPENCKDCIEEFGHPENCKGCLE